jgi:small-conductance mechanosensitive channel
MPPGRRHLTTVVLLATAALGGCGGPIKHDELERGVATLGATAAEGRLVALDVVEDRTKTTFVRVHSAALGDDAQHEAEKLADAQAPPDLVSAKAEAVRIAQAIDSALGDLQVSPSDRRVARQVEQRLDALSRQADRLTERL